MQEERQSSWEQTAVSRVIWKFGHPPVKYFESASRDQNVNNWRMNLGCRIFWYFRGVCINLVITLINKAANTNRCSHTNQNDFISWSLILSEREGRLSVTGKYEWLILWGVLLCSSFENYCQRVEASSLPKHAALAVPTWACLGREQRARWDRACYSDGWNTLAQNKHLLHIASGAHALLVWLNKRACMSGRFGFFSLPLMERRGYRWHAPIPRFHWQLPVKILQELRRRREEEKEPCFKCSDLSVASTKV